MRREISRRAVIGGIGAIGAATFGVRAQDLLPMPAKPVALNIVDVTGSLVMTEKAIENYRVKNPDKVSSITFSKGVATELAGKIIAQQRANRMDMDIILNGATGMVGGVTLGLWTDLLPAYSSVLPKPEEIYEPEVLRAHNLARGQGMAIAYTPSGPLIEYMPSRVANVPKTAEDLLAYTRENKNRFFYARPSTSGPGHTFLQGLAYILKDKDPKNAKNGWEKTWSYLKALGENIDYYAPVTGQTMKELGSGTRDMIASTVGWYINPRVLGIVPKEAKATVLEGFHWVADTQYFAVPKGVSAEKMPVILDLLKHMLQPDQQAYSFDAGYFYPGPAVKGTTLDMAPQESKDAIREFGWTDYDRLISSSPVEDQLDPEQLAYAFRRWDEEIGGAKR